MPKRLSGMLCASVLFSASFLEAQGPGQATADVPLTMQQAVERALQSNPGLISAREHLAAVQAQALTAQQRTNPNLTLLAQQATLPEVNNAGGNPFYYSANLSRVFERGQKRKWRMEGAFATGQQTEAQVMDQGRQLTLSVRQAFTTLLAAKGALEISQENLRDYRKTVELSRARLDAGDISRTDFDRIDLQLSQFEADDDSARLAILQTRTQLGLLLGMTRFDSRIDIVGSLDLPMLTLTCQQAEEAGILHRPDLAAAAQGLLAAEASARYAIAGGTADPTVAAEYERSGADNTFGTSVAIPLRLFDQNKGEKERTRYEVNAGRFALKAARNQVMSDVDQSWSSLETARRSANRYNTHYLEEAGRVRDNLQFSYRNGNTTLLDYLDALRSYRTIHLGSLNANAQVWLAMHALSFAAAMDVIP